MKQNKINEITKIYETKDYDLFITDPWYLNKTRASLLEMEADRGKQLPLVEVRELDDQYQVIGDLDSFYVSHKRKWPVRFYLSFRQANFAQCEAHNTLLTNNELDQLIEYIKGGGYFCEK